MSTFKKGTRVRQILPAPIEGTVVDYSVDRESGSVQVKVEWADANGDGVAESRFFNPDEIEAIPELEEKPEDEQ